MIREFRGMQSKQMGGFKHMLAMHMKQTTELRNQIRDQQKSIIARMNDLEKHASMEAEIEALDGHQPSMDL